MPSRTDYNAKVLQTFEDVQKDKLGTIPSVPHAEVRSVLNPTEFSTSFDAGSAAFDRVAEPDRGTHEARGTAGGLQHHLVHRCLNGFLQR